MRPVIFTAAFALVTFAVAPAALAQQGPPEPRVNQLVIYGDDKCPESTEGMITVCARKDEGERYRIPENLRATASPANEAWTQRVLAYETVGKFGTSSCSPTGAGGWTGCAGKLIDAAYAEKRQDPTIRFAELIAIERAKRMATIDQEAADTQQRVETLEADYEARRKAAEAAPPAPAKPAPTAPAPTSSPTPPRGN